jgi:regulator of PEP synthase PpsR (kinase-PPPase family)
MKFAAQQGQPMPRTTRPKSRARSVRKTTAKGTAPTAGSAGARIVSRPVQSPIPLYVLSDSTGNLARHMVTTFLTQFPLNAFQLQVTPFIGEQGRLAEALATIAKTPGIVFHAVVSPQFKAELSRQCDQMNVACCDLTGPTVDFLAHVAGIQPHEDEQLLHRVDPVYVGRINAMSFTLEHDDGLGLDSLGEADVVLAGVSRTGKTPTSVYLAMQGYRVANVALAAEAPVPQQLRQLPRRKAVGLIIEPAHLADIRGRRERAWNMAPSPYSHVRRVRQEIEWSRRLFRELNMPMLDVTEQAIEETAARVLDLLGLTEPALRSDKGLS